MLEDSFVTTGKTQIVFVKITKDMRVLAKIERGKSRYIWR